MVIYHSKKVKKKQKKQQIQVESGYQPGDSSRDLFIPECWRSRSFAFDFGSRFHSPSQKGHELAELPGTVKFSCRLALSRAGTCQITDPIIQKNFTAKKNTPRKRRNDELLEKKIHPCVELSRFVFSYMKMKGF